MDRKEDHAGLEKDDCDTPPGRTCPIDEHEQDVNGGDQAEHRDETRIEHVPHNRVARWVEKPCIVASGVNQRRNAHEDKTSRQVASALDESQPQREPVDREKKVVKRADMDAKERERQLREIDITQVVIADASDVCFGFAMFP